jgi:quinohemoprotein ethanol dehydrogenase
MEMAARTWAGNYADYGGGGTVWNSIAHDPELGLIYFGTANGQSWNKAARGDPKGDNLFVASIVALKADTGEYVWHYQETPGDMWDFDSTANPVLADLEIGGKPRKVLLHAPKNSFFYVLDRATGELISAEKFAPANWATHVDLKTGRPAVDLKAADWSTGPKLLIPGPVGSHNWQPMSYSPKTRLVYIPAQEAPGVLAPVPAADQKPQGEGQWSAGADFRVPEDAKTWRDAAEAYKGRLLAWDPVAQKAVWSQEHDDVWNGGTLATAGNLVFQGTADGRFVAYSADKGEKLWEAIANSGVMAGPMSFEIDGEQYISVMAGWGGAYPLLIGPVAAHTRVMPEARVLTYKLGGTATLPPPRNLPAAPPEPPALSADAKVVDHGRRLYAANCAVCHGMGAISGRIVPDLRYLTAGKHAEFAATVAGARASNGMPSFAGKLDVDEVEALHQYLIQRAHDLRKDLAAATTG